MKKLFSQYCNAPKDFLIENSKSVVIMVLTISAITTTKSKDTELRKINNKFQKISDYGLSRRGGQKCPPFL